MANNSMNNSINSMGSVIASPEPLFDGLAEEVINYLFVHDNNFHLLTSLHPLIFCRQRFFYSTFFTTCHKEAGDNQENDNGTHWEKECLLDPSRGLCVKIAANYYLGPRFKK